MPLCLPLTAEILESIRSSLSNPLLLHVSIGMTLKTAPVSGSLLSWVFLPLISSTCADTYASVPNAWRLLLAWHNAQSTSLNFLSTYIDLTGKVLVTRYHCLRVDIDSIYIQYDLVWTIHFCVSAIHPCGFSATSQ